MKIKEAWGVIAGLDIELVEQYSVKEYDRWRDAVQTMQKFLQPILEEQKAEVVTTFGQKSRKRRANPKTQFELKTISRKDLIKEAYEWCKQNLPLKDERGIIFQVDELYIITSSQSVIDKVNNHFGSKLGFGLKGEKIFFLM
jgi:hypothetical protein